MTTRNTCHGCRLAVADDDAVWVDPKTGAATTGSKGRPYHVACAPEQLGDVDDERDRARDNREIHDKER